MLRAAQVSEANGCAAGDSRGGSGAECALQVDKFSWAGSSCASESSSREQVESSEGACCRPIGSVERDGRQTADSRAWVRGEVKCSGRVESEL
jgi:hypothetical protein